MTTTRAAGPTAPIPPGWVDRTLLTDPSRCPACGSSLVAHACTDCGLDVANPLAAQVWSASTRAAALLDERDGLIGAIRAAARPAEAAPTPVMPRPVAPGPVTLPPVVGQQVRPEQVERPLVLERGPAVPPPPPTTPRHPAPAAPARLPVPTVVPTRSSWPLQNVLLGLGALLLAGASLVFLVFTWGQMPLALRATAIAVLTAAVFAAAGVAARRNLRSSAEFIGGLGALLVVLDAWALHATGLVSVPAGAAYAALATVVCGAVLVGLGTLLRVASPRVAGWLLVPTAPAVLTLTGTGPAASALLLALAAALCTVRFLPRGERRARAGLAVEAAAFAALSAVVSIVTLVVDGPLVASGCLLVLAGVLHGWAWFCAPRVTAWSATAGVLQTLAALSFVLGLFGSVETPQAIWLAPLGGLLGAMSVSLLVRAVPRLGATASLAARVTFLVVASVPVWFLALAMMLLVATAVAPSASPLGVGTIWAALAGLVVAGGGSVVLRVLRREPAAQTAGDADHPSWFVALGVVALSLLAPTVVWTICAWLAVALLVTALVAPRVPRRWRTAARTSAVASVGLATVTSMSLAAGTGASPDSEQVVTHLAGQVLLGASLVVVSVLLLLARRWIPDGPQVDPRNERRRRAVLLFQAVLAGAAGAGVALQAIVPARSIGWLVALPLLLACCAAVSVELARMQAGLASRPHGRWSIRGSDLRALVGATALVAVPLVGVTVLEPWWLDRHPEAPEASTWVLVLAVVAIALAAALSWLLTLTHHVVVPGGTSVITAGLTPLLTVLTVLGAQALFLDRGVEWGLLSIVVAAAFLVIASTRGDEPHHRAAMEQSAAALVGVALVVVATTRPAHVLTAALLVSAVGALAWAFTPGRSRLGWLALGLALVGSWTALGARDITTVEAYTAPGAVALVLTAVWRLRRRGTASTGLLLGGLTLLVVPTVLLAPAGHEWRALAVVGAVVVLGAVARSMAPGTTTTVALTVLALVSAVIGVGGRALVLASSEVSAHGARDQDLVSAETAVRLLGQPTSVAWVWILVATGLVAATTWLLARSWRWEPTGAPRTWGAVLAVLVLTIPTAVLISGEVVSQQGASWIVVGLVVLWGAVAVLGTPPGLPRVSSRADFVRRAVPPLVGSYAVALLLQRAGDVPLHVLLTISGVFVAYVTVRAAVVETTSATSSNVAYGVVATLAPPTIAMMSAPDGLSIAVCMAGAAAWLLAGLRLRWKAPVGIGAGALVLQTVVLAGPPALAVLAGVPGWLVLAVTGLALLLLGLTYERQIASARATLRRYAELR